VEFIDGVSEVQGNEDRWLREGGFVAAESVQVVSAAGGSIDGVLGIHGGGGVRCRREGGEGEGEGMSAGVCDDAFGQPDDEECGELKKGDERGDGCAEERRGRGGDDGRVVGFGGEREAWGLVDTVNSWKWRRSMASRCRLLCHFTNVAVTSETLARESYAISASFFFFLFICHFYFYW